MHKGLSLAAAKTLRLRISSRLPASSSLACILPCAGTGTGSAAVSGGRPVGCQIRLQLQSHQRAWLSSTSSISRDKARNTTDDKPRKNNEKLDSATATAEPKPIKSNTAESIPLGFVPLQNQAEPADQDAARDNVRHNTEQQTSWEAMSSDQSYLDFLNKANAPLDSSGADAAQQASAGRQGGLHLVDAGEDIPRPLAALGDAVYTSDADEPFVPVVLRWDETGNKGLPDESEFLALIKGPANAPVTIMDPSDWDGLGHYQTVLDAVRHASEGADVRVYRVEMTGTRVEYFLVSCEGLGKDARLVGLKALAIES
ncbi:hypothetical protein BROUX41_005252 [Berkeleyomyces rouxiae]